MTDIASLGIKIDSKGVVSATRDLDKLEKQGKATEKVAGSLKAAFVALGGVLSAREIINYSDAYVGVRNQLRLATKSHEELITVQSKLLNIANDTASEIGATAELYATLTRNTEELNLSQAKTLRVTELINKSFLITGKSAEEASGAIRQLSQGLAAGALRGDEFNSVAEGAPEIMRAIRKETGKTAGELRDFAAEGQITAELLINALINYGDELDKAAEKAELAFGSKMTIANNNITTFIGGLESSTGAVGNFGDLIVSLSENLDTLAKIAEVAALIYGARFIGSLASSGMAMLASAAKATAMQTAVVGLGSATGVYTRNATLAEKATKGLSVASTGLKGALALLGGPAGVITLLAAELFLYHRSLKEAEKAAFDAAHPNYELEVQAQRTKEQIEKLKDAVITYNKNIAEMERKGAPIEGVNRLKEMVAGYEAEIKRLQASLTKPSTGNSGGTGGGDTEEYDKAKSALDKLNASLLQQVSTLGMGESAVLKYRLEYGDLRDEVAAMGEQGESYKAGLLSLAAIHEKLQKQEESRNKTLEEQKRIQEEIQTSYDATVTSLQQQLDMLGMTGREVAIYQAQLRLSANANQEMRDEVALLAGELYDEQKTAEKAAEIEAIRKQLFDETRTELERFNIEMAYYTKLLKDGVIDQDVFNRKIADMKQRVAESYGLIVDTVEESTSEMTVFMEEFAKNTQNLLADNLFNFMQGEFEFTADSFKKMLDRMVADAIAADLASKLFDNKESGEKGLFSKGFDLLAGMIGGGGSGVRTDSMAIAESWAPSASYDGGGFTGYGSRSGGLDGKGGFPALLHPNETVIDHTKGQKMTGDSIIVNVYQTFGSQTSATQMRQSAAQAYQAAFNQGSRDAARNN